jgi:hypothetical protein
MITGGSTHLDAVGGPGCKVGSLIQSPELPLFARKPASGDHQLRYLLHVLSDGLWHTARELKVHGFTDRELRELVESSDGQIFSFPGSPGYKLFDFITEEEFGQCASLKHQAERMLARYSRYHARHHRGR